MEVTHCGYRISLQNGHDRVCTQSQKVQPAASIQLQKSHWNTQQGMLNHGSSMSVIVSAFFQFSIYISIYAAHLYDSVMLYAKALDHMIAERLGRGEGVDISELARDGKYCCIFLNIRLTLMTMFESFRERNHQNNH